MGIKVRVKRLSCLGSCLSRPIIELRWSHEERVYDVRELDEDMEGGNGNGGGNCDQRDVAWNAYPEDNAAALGLIALQAGDESRLEIMTARLIDKTA